MTGNTPTMKPYSTLPEPYLLVAAVVWIDLLAASWPNVTQGGFLTRALVYGGLLGVASAHSWFFARRANWSGATVLIVATVLWLMALGGGVAALEWRSVVPELGLLACLQIVQCSFVFNHASLKLTHLVSFIVMLAATPHLPLKGGGLAWFGFALISMFILAYGRTAQKAGPAGYGRGEVRRTGERTLLVSAICLLASLMFFVTPLLKWPDLPRSSRNGTSRTGQGGEYESALRPEISREALMRVRTDPPTDGPLYLRGQAFDVFDGVNWSNDSRVERDVAIVDGEPTSLGIPSPEYPTRPPQRIVQSYELLTNMHETLFSAGRPASVRFDGVTASRIFVGASDRALRVEGYIPAGTRYTVESYNDVIADTTRVNVSYSSDAGDVTSRDLEVPPGTSPRVIERAKEVTASAQTPYQKAAAIERYLRTSFSYSLSHDVRGPNVVEDFLFRAKRGHCALFASSMVIMARAVGLPARYVSGFLAQTPEKDGGFVVRGSDGHAWVEVNTGSGWVAFDPTSSRVDPADMKTRELTGGQGTPTDVRVTGGQRTHGGLYGRDSGSGSFGDSGGDQISRNDGGTGVPGGAGGPGGIGGAGTTSQNGTGAPGQTGQPGGVNPSSRSVIPPGGRTTLPSNAQSSSSRTPDSSRNVVPPSGKTTLPNPPKAADPPPDPATMERDWRMLVIALLGLGLVGIAALLIWQNGIRRAVDRREIRRALPLSVDDDPDARRFIVKLYHTMVNGLSRVGFAKRDWDTPAEYADAVGRRDEGLGRPVGDLTELFHAARYGDVPVTADDAGVARAAWRRIATSVKRVEPDTNEAPSE